MGLWHLLSNRLYRNRLALAEVPTQLYLAVRPFVSVRYFNLFHRRNLIPDRPGLMNSISGILTVIVGVYASQHGDWSGTPIITLIFVLLSLVYMLSCFVFYQVWMLGTLE